MAALNAFQRMSSRDESEILTKTSLVSHGS